MSIAVERFDHIVLNCRDVEATAAWYERVLGRRRETFGPSQRTALCFGDQKINLRPVGASAEDPDWFTGSVEVAGSEDLCFVTRADPADVRAQAKSPARTGAPGNDRNISTPRAPRWWSTAAPSVATPARAARS